MKKIITSVVKGKATKNCYRYDIIDNDKGIVGSVYINKTSLGEHPPEKLRIKVFEPKKVK